MSFAQVTLIGNLGNDPELRYMPDGRAVCNMSVATNRKWTTPNPDPEKDRIQHEEVTWWRIGVFGAQAESCNTWLRKGSQVMIQGRVRPDDNGSPRMFSRQDGSVGTSYELFASTVKFLSGGQSNGNGASVIAPGGPNADEEDEIPF